MGRKILIAVGLGLVAFGGWWIAVVPCEGGLECLHWLVAIPVMAIGVLLSLIGILHGRFRLVFLLILLGMAGMVVTWFLLPPSKVLSGELGLVFRIGFAFLAFPVVILGYLAYRKVRERH